jgi:hypothetical protein
MEPFLLNLQPFVDPGAMQELRNIIGDIQRRIERVDHARGSGGGTDHPSLPE